MGKHSKFDAIIAGAGHNGLITAANLAKAGLKVLIVEKNEYIGGAVVSRELHEGWTYSICSSVCSQQCFATSERWGGVMSETKQTTTMGLISRTSFIGDLGYELWVDWAKGQALWDRLWAAGDHWGLRAIGFEALNICRIEAGYIAVVRLSWGSTK